MQLFTQACSLVVCFLAGTRGFTWDTPLEDWANISVRKGEDLRVDWGYSLSEQEAMEGIVWLMYLHPPRFREIAVKHGENSGDSAFFVRDFYAWGSIRQFRNAGLILTNPPGGKQGGIIQIIVQTVPADVPCCPPPPFTQHVRHVKYVVNDSRPKTPEEEKLATEMERRLVVPFSSMYPGTPQQISDCPWCAQPWRRRVIITARNSAREGGYVSSLLLPLLLLALWACCCGGHRCSM